MRKIGVVVLAAATAIAFAVVGSGPAVADHAFNKNQCEAANGTWVNLGRGQKECEHEPEEGKNPRFECTETTTGGPGNLKPHKDTDTTEEGEGTGSGKCPPGQFK